MPTSSNGVNKPQIPNAENSLIFLTKTYTPRRAFVYTENNLSNVPCTAGSWINVTPVTVVDPESLGITYSSSQINIPGGYHYEITYFQSFYSSYFSHTKIEKVGEGDVSWGTSAYSHNQFGNNCIARWTGYLDSATNFRFYYNTDRSQSNGLGTSGGDTTAAERHVTAVQIIRIDV